MKVKFFSYICNTTHGIFTSIIHSILQIDLFLCYFFIISGLGLLIVFWLFVWLAASGPSNVSVCLELSKTNKKSTHSLITITRNYLKKPCHIFVPITTERNKNCTQSLPNYKTNKLQSWVSKHGLMWMPTKVTVLLLLMNNRKMKWTAFWAIVVRLKVYTAALISFE